MFIARVNGVTLMMRADRVSCSSPTTRSVPERVEVVVTNLLAS